MTDLPRRPVDPLAAPEGAYDAVRRRAAARRARTAAGGGLLAVALAGASVVGADALRGEPTAQTIQVATPTPTPTDALPASPTAEPTEAPSSPPPVVTVSPSATALPPPPTSAPTADEEPPPEPVYTGRVVDTAGRPVAGAWLITVLPDGAQAKRIGDDGVYEGQCGGPRELIAMWDASRTGTFKQPRGMRNLAATWVGGARPVPCSEREVTTVLREGGIITGRISYVDREGRVRPYDDGANPGGGLYCEELFDSEGTQCANWDPVDGRYRFAGLPTGRFQLWGMYGGQTVQVQAGKTTELDWYECDGCRGASPRPSPSASPQPS